MAGKTLFLTAIAYVDFDSTKLELVSSKALAESAKVNVLNGRVHMVFGNTDAIFNPTKYEAVTTTGAVAELTFKVLVEADEEFDINLVASQGNVYDADGKFNAITVSGDVLNVHAVGAEHDCDAYETRPIPTTGSDTTTDPTSGTTAPTTGTSDPTKPTEKPNQPATGDGMPVVALGMMLLASILCATALVFSRKKWMQK